MSRANDELHRIMHSRPGRGPSDTAYRALSQIGRILDDEQLGNDEALEAVTEVINAWEQYRYPGGKRSNCKEAHL